MSSRGQKFKLVKGKNGPTAFLSLGSNLGGNNKEREINKYDNTSKEYLTMKPADYIYRKVRIGIQ